MIKSTFENPLVSIALCTYNGVAFIQEQLDSLINQSYPNIEIIVFDDFSTDGTWEVLQSYAQKYPQFHIHRNEKNLGYTKNFGKAIKSCKGELIALADQDDIWDQEKISLQVASINDHLLIYHDSELILESGESTEKRMSDIINLYRGDCPKCFLMFNCVSGHSCMFKKELLPYLFPFPAGYHHDHWIAYVAANRGSIGFVDKPLVKYRQHRNSSTDILQIRTKPPKGYHANRDIKKLEKELNWLKNCASYTNNKHPRFITRMKDLFEKRLSAFTSFRYAWFLLQHQKKLLFIQKKSIGSKVFFIYKQIWGLRAKLWWGKLLISYRRFQVFLR